MRATRQAAWEQGDQPGGEPGDRVAAVATRIDALGYFARGVPNAVGVAIEKMNAADFVRKGGVAGSRFSLARHQIELPGSFTSRSRTSMPERRPVTMPIFGPGCSCHSLEDADGVGAGAVWPVFQRRPLILAAREHGIAAVACEVDGELRHLVDG